ncbi:hypothetical protein G647_07636 [Cladophialophora carrionii CBS 160.54]|uniref:EamA domain-containing protein n=1 Tax=Cladophialophora carrionii CBS 160.54 TaxID=1279043 RepID=V9D331_9EURO|nr:uncharacterized protein G647_07636 [Cladophialophora carrionii CBS 160.54]ETI21290.1 hypothetical protein G647_07636 [Cladophialophora carrionii CBS 160.54]
MPPTARQRRKERNPSAEGRTASPRLRARAKVPTPPADAAMDVSSLVAAWRRQPMWMLLAVTSGACAAFNGVFAKLTTTSLTSSLSASVATLLGLSPANTTVDVLVRGAFFGLNLLFNALMWALFTAALTRAESTTRVSIINVSANFMITALLGWMVFGEQLRGMWWAGAAMLAAGNVVIGRREEGKKSAVGEGMEPTAAGHGEAEGLMRGEEDNGRDVDVDLVELDDGVGRGREDGLEPQHGDEQRRLRAGQEVDAPI